jgi:hypothetical protein
LAPGAGIDTPTMIGNRRLLNTITRTQSKRDVALPTVAAFFGVLLWFLFMRGYTMPGA